QALNARPQGEMLALDFLGVTFADGVLFGGKVTCVGAPLIRKVVHEAEGLQEGFELAKDGILTTSKDIRQDIRQDRSCLMINGMPQPAWMPFVADKRPHLIHLGLASSLNVYGNPLRVQRT